jgi:hypothetical protein
MADFSRGFVTAPTARKQSSETPAMATSVKNWPTKTALGTEDTLHLEKHRGSNNGCSSNHACSVGTGSSKWPGDRLATATAQQHHK